MSRSERLERAVLVLIVIVVGALAGRASFNHVVQWSMANMPPGTDRSYGYTNAAVSELLPVGVLLFVRYRRRQCRPPGHLAWSMLVAAGLFSLTAQLAVALPSLSGWLVASVPTLAFIALTKLLLSIAPVGAMERPPPRVTAARPHPAPATPHEPRPHQPRPRPVPPVTTIAIPEVGAVPVAKRVTAKSLTNAAKVADAVTELGADAKPAQVAAKAGVSESTARRHMPRMLPSPAGSEPAT